MFSPGPQEEVLRAVLTTWHVQEQPRLTGRTCLKGKENCVQLHETPVFLGPFDSFPFPCDLHLEWLPAYVSLSCEHRSGGKPWEGLSQKL